MLGPRRSVDAWTRRGPLPRRSQVRRLAARPRGGGRRPRRRARGRLAHRVHGRAPARRDRRLGRRRRRGARHARDRRPGPRHARPHGGRRRPVRRQRLRPGDRRRRGPLVRGGRAGVRRPGPDPTRPACGCRSSRPRWCSTSAGAGTRAPAPTRGSGTPRRPRRGRWCRPTDRRTADLRSTGQPPTDRRRRAGSGPGTGCRVARGTAPGRRGRRRAGPCRAPRTGWAALVVANAAGTPVGWRDRPPAPGPSAGGVARVRGCSTPRWPSSSPTPSSTSPRRAAGPGGARRARAGRRPQPHPRRRRRRLRPGDRRGGRPRRPAGVRWPSRPPPRGPSRRRSPAPSADDT